MLQKNVYKHSRLKIEEAKKPHQPPLKTYMLFRKHLLVECDWERIDVSMAAHSIQLMVVN